MPQWHKRQESLANTRKKPSDMPACVYTARAQFKECVGNLCTFAPANLPPPARSSEAHAQPPQVSTGDLLKLR